MLLRDSPERKISFALEASQEIESSGDKASVIKNTHRGEPNKENKPAINAVSRLICDKYGKSNIIESRNRRSK